MDYSAAIAEDPAAASPWGSSSPRAQRTPFTGATPDSPTTPTRHNHTDSQSSLPEPALPNPDLAENDGAFSGQQVQNEPILSQPLEGQQSTLPHDALQASQQSSQQQQRPVAARYHSARPQKQVPQYKLQAKITALERTGRKDPVLRFDVYVSIVAIDAVSLY